MKVVLFCGGRGLRLGGGAEAVPKPMVTIGDRPILWYVMKYYAHYGHREFIICLGYRGDVIRRFFDAEAGLDDCRITCVDTGIDANIAQRLQAVRSYVAGEMAFLANYSDGLTDLDLRTYLDHFHRQDTVAALACARPNSTLHTVSIDGGGLVSQLRPLETAGLWINGGFFAFKPAIFDYIEHGEDLVDAPFQRLIRERELLAYPVNGFWACMDTFKDKQFLEAMHRQGLAPWEVWRRPGLNGHARRAAVAKHASP